MFHVLILLRDTTTLNHYLQAKFLSQLFEPDVVTIHILEKFSTTILRFSYYLRLFHTYRLFLCCHSYEFPLSTGTLPLRDQIFEVYHESYDILRSMLE